MSNHIYLDATGLVCPLPAAETRKSLQAMQPGQTLEVKGDFSLAVENVVRMVEKMGAEILEKESSESSSEFLLKNNDSSYGI